MEINITIKSVDSIHILGRPRDDSAGYPPSSLPLFPLPRPSVALTLFFNFLLAIRITLDSIS
jgi:hypothetical protein